MVLPLRWRGQARSVAFTYRDGRLISDSIELCGFVYLVGEDEGEQSAPITHDETILLHWDRDQPFDLDALHGVLDRPCQRMVRGNHRGRRALRRGVAAADRHRPTGVPPQRPRRHQARGLRPDLARSRTPLVEGSSLAYLTSRRREDGGTTRWELGATGHGPAATELARHRCDEIRAWSVHRDERKATLVAYPADTPDSELPGLVIDKTHSRFVLTYETE
ncbi:hypothetical protein [Amycolatopsis jejuensis]|uniref:hypothetical protein n=1 Tax=Amycolatopsis jejuensis TaxID=330084 RepID=UPI001FDFD628|nr:hypothetical protein [Amycolatopsis jejuensis]